MFEIGSLQNSLHFTCTQTEPGQWLWAKEHGQCSRSHFRILFLYLRIPKPHEKEHSMIKCGSAYNEYSITQKG
jgi:hypothetical protein